MRKFFSLRSRKLVELEGIEGQVDCASHIARHKLSVYKKLVYLFIVVHALELINSLAPQHI
jgi:hypothetical protein